MNTAHTLAAEVAEAPMPDELPLTPAGYRVLVRMPEPKTKTASGLHLPDASAAAESAAVQTAEVVAIGPDAYASDFFKSRYCAIGDWVILAAFGGMRFRWRGREYRLLADQDILGVTGTPAELERIR